MSTKLKAGTATSGAVIDADTAGILELQSGSSPTTAITIDASQNVGVGTSSPVRKLDVNGDLGTKTSNGNIALTQGTSTNSGYLSLWNAANTTRVGYIGFATLSGIGEFTFASENVSNSMVFNVGGSERMRLTANGDMLINTGGAVISSSSFLNIKGVANARSCATLAVGANGNGAIDFFNASNAYVAAITVNSSSVSYNTTSDYRLKENITPMVGALDKVSALKPVTYTWKSTGEASQGFIAHELAEIVPDCVSGEKDAVDADGKPLYQGVDTSFLVATLTAAIQELNAKVDAQAAEIASLKGAK